MLSTGFNYGIGLYSIDDLPQGMERFVYKACRYVYAKSVADLGDEYEIVIPNYNASTKEDTSETFRIPKRNVVSIENLNTVRDGLGGMKERED